MSTAKPSIDLKRLAAEVSVQHGIRIDADDPLMVVVTLNRLVFEQAVAQVLERVQSSVRDFDVAVDKVQVRAGAVLAQEVRDCGVAMRREFARTFEDLRPGEKESRWANRDASSKPGSRSWLVASLALALILFGLGIWVGSKLR
jgi:hypothetical protein